jgi:hypothetical protein
MQVVHYDPKKEDTFIEKGKAARVYPLDHPSPFVSNDANRPCITTRVKSYNASTGIFTTQNTKYVPKQD